MKEQIIRGRFLHRANPEHVDRVLNIRRGFRIAETIQSLIVKYEDAA